MVERILLLILVLHLPLACERKPTGPRTQIADLDKCQRGIERAESQTNLSDAMRTYLTECSSVYVEPACKQALLKAADAEQVEHLKIIAGGCRKAYCPLLADRQLELCRSGAEPRPDALTRSWPALHDAILAYDAASYAPHLSKVMLRFYAHAGALKASSSNAAASAALSPAASTPELAASAVTEAH